MRPLLPTLCVATIAGLSAALVHPARPAQTPAAEDFKVDGAHSFVVFHTRHLGISEAFGRFDRISEEKSQVVLGKDMAKSSILLVVDPSSVDTNNAKRDEHLRSDDFLSAKEFAEIVFESTRISGTEKELEVAGDLTFHGVTKAVKARGRMIGRGDTVFGDHRAGFLAEFTIDLGDYGIAFLKQNPGAVGPEVTLTVSLECARK